MADCLGLAFIFGNHPRVCRLWPRQAESEY